MVKKGVRQRAVVVDELVDVGARGRELVLRNE